MKNVNVGFLKDKYLKGKVDDLEFIIMDYFSKIRSWRSKEIISKKKCLEFLEWRGLSW